MAKTIPDGYHSIQPYLIFKGAAAAIDFYQRAFGVTERLRMPRPDGLIAHAELEFGDSCIMLADEHPEIGALSPEYYGGSPVSLMFYVDDCDAVYRQALAAGATSTREPADQPYGDRMAGVKDPFGYSWYLGTHIKDLTKNELEALKM
ncbi:VOC family protein [Silvibacterium dinghuense]|uniref:VOC family protein n=1 Tax=Silvibacterium dinghuense TaxID=1560006 RepID=A0A4Q1SFZ8_9BACT|nr:VOC family protein [Silvibacterium dinghuense]RXS96466.1 VOC family protein [Silvibacterium dinghuense]GGG90991.1 glyoxalase [Silvibacterium dinghuense]